MSRSNLRSTILGFTLLSCLLSFDTAHGFNEDRIKVESNFIFVKYDHELKGEPTGYHQRIDISSFGQVIPKKYVDGDEFNLNWADFGTFRIKKKDDKCEDYELTSKRDQPLRVRFDTSNIFLYGGPEQDYQGWPVDYNKYYKYSYVSKEKDSQAVLESFWLFTNGMYLHVDEKTPLFITQDKSKGVFELIASREAPYIRSGGVTEMKYTICKLDNMKEAHKHAVSTKVIGKPSGLPDTKAVKYPIWSTWAMYLSKIDDQVVADYANLITQSKLPNSQLEIDDKWETCYGSLTVNRTTFPDMKELVARLHAKNFGVTMWVHPFVNTGCEPFFSEGVEKGYFVKNTAGSVVSSWWNGEGAYIDFTNPEAAAWWQNRLKKLLAETGLDGYKFDAGESSWAPQPSVFHVMDESHPETNLKAYIKACAEFGTNIEVRSGRGTQQYPIFVRMIDRETNWDSRLGLQTLIPTLLQMNILGYPFVLPDMVGGNGYGDKKPSDELFIRWLQANVFMPSIQFSFPPSMFSVEVQRLTTKFVEMHVKYSNKIIEAMENSVKYGTPVNPPLWWIDPTDPTTFHIDSEFLLGEDILIAPVLENGARSRDIYLPKGYWKDEVNENAEIIKGPIWLYNYPADLGTLPFFTKVNAPESHTEHEEKKNSGVSLMPTFTSIFFAIILTKFYSWCFCN